VIIFSLKEISHTVFSTNAIPILTYSLFSNSGYFNLLKIYLFQFLVILIMSRYSIFIKFWV